MKTTLALVQLLLVVLLLGIVVERVWMTVTVEHAITNIEHKRK
jgi:hypothetical protein